MPRVVKLPGAEAVDVEDDVCRCFIMRIFHRALVDALGANNIMPQHRRDAKAWLFSKSMKKFSAAWWAREASLEYILGGCRKMLETGPSAESKHRLNSSIFRVRLGYLKRRRL